MDAKDKKRYLSMVGAGIVLLSFIGSGILDNYKDKASELGASLALLISRKGIIESPVNTQISLDQQALDKIKQSQNSNENATNRTPEEIAQAGLDDALKAEGLVNSQTMAESEEANKKLDAIKDAVKDNEEQHALFNEEQQVENRSNTASQALLEAQSNYTSVGLNPNIPAAQRT
jgi:hypothetical protein